MTARVVYIPYHTFRILVLMARHLLHKTYN